MKGARRRRTRLFGAVGAALLLLAGGFVLHTLWLAGEFREFEPHFDGACRLVRGVPGPEDLTVHPRTGVAYLSSCDRRALSAGRPRPGAIYAYDLRAPAPVPVNLTPDADLSFQPHGLSVFAGPDGRDTLFVVNHRLNGNGEVSNSVDVFDLDGLHLAPRASLTDALLVMPNDVVAVGADRFYVTNTHAQAPGWRQTVESWLRLSGARVVRFADGRFETALDGLVMPNGIQVSRDGRTLFLASSTGRSLRVYDRDPERETLALRSTVPLDGAPDALELDAAGGVWIGSHPQILELRRHGDDPGRRAPSQVLRVGPDLVPEEVYLSEGEPLAGASVAAFWEGRLLIGQIFDDGFLDCRTRGR